MSEFHLFVYGTLRGGGADSDGTGDRAGVARGGSADGGAGVARGGGADGDGAGGRGRSGAAGPMAGCVRIADATIGGTLYDIDGRFPALVHYGDDPVRGEVWRCPSDLLLALDAYEGTASGLFRRVAAEIETDEGERLPCWLYTAGPALSRHLTPSNRVASGYWQARTLSGRIP